MIKPTKTTGKLVYKKHITETIIEVGYKLETVFSFTPGQFSNMLVTPPFRRPYSIIDLKNRVMSLMIEIRDPGRGSDYFRNAEIGSETEVLGSLGRFGVRNTPTKKVFISTGAGVAPFISMIKYLEQINFSEKVMLFQGMKYLKDDCAWPYLSDLVNKNFLDYTRCITREESSLIDSLDSEFPNTRNKLGRVTEIIPKLNFDWANTEFYICGSNQMVKDTKIMLQNLGATNIYLENYG